MKSCILITYLNENISSEAKSLCEAAQYNVLYTIKVDDLQKRKYGITESKVEELEEKLEKLKPDVIVFDELLKPNQNYSLAAKLKIEIVDRESLILEIFESRASSAESKLQVKLAQLRYERARAKERVRLAKGGEQPGFMGIGKFEIDAYYDDIKNRGTVIKTKLEKAGKQRALHRQGRDRLGFKTISLAGYTSAGKTTLFNNLTGETKEKSAELFTTLTTTTRRLKLGREISLITDTVGFISKLPAYLIEAFKSTLEELIFTDVILVIIDSLDDDELMKKKFSTCYKTLVELGVERKNMIFLFNKSESLDDKKLLHIMNNLKIDEVESCLDVSALTGKNLKELKEKLQERFYGKNE
ncbi:MAG: GTPase HflX [Thermoproteota archaeon]|nr:GTPase HflX [Thermoproteota archaeon]MEC9416344.1 GTPase HflX [Thermoproteota archaeon]